MKTYDTPWEGCTTAVEQVDRHTTVVRCPSVGFEGIWSTTEAGTFGALLEEHLDAHRRAYAAALNRGGMTLRQHAWHVYRTTEPGDPARRGIGPYL